MKYGEAIEHVKKCDYLVQPCRLGCGLGILGQDMEYHCKKQCENIEIVCPVCEEWYKPTLLKKENIEHDCI